MNYPTPYGNSDDLARENERLRQLVKDLKEEKVSLNAWIEHLSRVVQENNSWTVVLPCDIYFEAPYDFKYCETHDRTFALDGDCDHRGLTEIDYLTDREMKQRGRAVIAEMKLAELVVLAEIALENSNAGVVPAADIIDIAGSRV